MIPLLWRRGALLRLGLGVAALALAGGAVLGTQLTSGALQHQATAAVSQQAGRAQYDITPFSRAGFDLAQVRAISHLGAVVQSAPLWEKPDLAQLPSGAFRQVELVADSTAEGVALRTLPLLQGRSPRGAGQVAVSQDLSPGIAVGSGAVQSGAVRLGQRLRLVSSHGDAVFRVVGLVARSAPGAPFTADAVYVSQGVVRHLFRSGLRAAEVAVRLRPGATASDLLQQLSQTVHTQYTVSDPRQVPQGDPIAELRPVLDGITGLSLVLAFAVIWTTFSALALERRREIGLLRLAGARSTLLFRSFLGEAVAASALGGAVGVGVGYLLALVLLNLSVGAGSGPAPLALDAPWIAGAFLLVLVLGALAAVAPALQASRGSALSAIRPMTPLRRWPRAALALPLLALGVAGSYYFFRSGGGLGVALGVAFAYLAITALLALFGPWLVRALGTLLGPALGTPSAAVGLRSQARPGRSALALCGLFVSFATAIGLVGLSSAALGAGEQWVDHLFVGQYLLVSPVTESPRVETQLLQTITSGSAGERVVAAAPVGFVPARVGHAAVSVASTVTTAYALSGALQFVSGSRTQALTELSGGRALLAPLALAQSLHLHLGSEVEVVTTGGRARFSVAGIVAHTLPGPSGQESLMVDRSVAVAAFGSAARDFNLIQLELRGGGGLQRAVALAAFRYGMAEESVATVRQGVDQGVAHDIAALTALALVGVVVAVLAAVNTVVLDSRQDQRQMALLRMVGLSRARTRLAILGEVLATCVAGCGVGVLVGIGLIFPEVRAASSVVLPLSFSVPWRLIIAIALAVVVAMLASAWLPARQVSEADPAVALSVE